MWQPGLRAAGLRVTAARLAVYDAVAGAPHCAADDVATAVRTRLGAASTQGVYDALRVLTEQGLLRRIEPAGSPARYEARTGDNHHHVVCRRLPGPPLDGTPCSSNRNDDRMTELDFTPSRLPPARA